MKTIVVHEFGGPEVLRLDDVPDPVAGPGEVVVRVRAAGVNPVDTYIRSGGYGRMAVPPYTPGSDGAGEVVSVGADVTSVVVGDRVYLAGAKTGTYAEMALCAADNVYPLPANVSFAQGAGVNVPYATAWRSLFGRAEAQPGETVLIHGASGGVGIAGVQIARAHGLTVIGTAGSEAGKTLVKNEGAHHVLDHTQDGYLDAVMTLTDGRGVGIILEMLANVNLGRDLTVLAKHGRVVVIGSRGPVEIDPRDTMGRDASILGMVLFNVEKNEMKGIHAALVAGLENNTLRPIVGTEIPLAEAARAHREIIENSHAGKIVLIP